MLATQAGIDMVHVPYKGDGPALVDIIAGRVDIFFGNLAAALRFQQAASANPRPSPHSTRSPVAPDVPNVAEIGLPDLIAVAWFAVVAPPGTPEAIVADDQQGHRRALALARRAHEVPRAGRRAAGRAAPATAAFIKEEEARWRKVIKSANVTLDDRSP